MVAARRHKQALAVAILLLVVAAADLTAVLLWQPTSRSVLHDVLVVLWPLPALAGFLLGTYELFLHQRLVTEIGRISGPGIVEHLLPSEVLRTFLSRIYGSGQQNDDVVAGVLGGSGMRPKGDDLTISTRTTVRLELQGVDTKTYHLTTTQTHQFRHSVPVDRFVIFATSNATLRDTISAACRFPCSSSTSCRTRHCSSTRSTTSATRPRSRSTTSTTTARAARPNPARSRRSRSASTSGRTT